MSFENWRDPENDAEETPGSERRALLILAALAALALFAALMR